MHWTFEEYEAQPQWFIDTLSIKMEEDTKYQQSQNKPGK
jgi:hypothetical protein